MLLPIGVDVADEDACVNDYCADDESRQSSLISISFRITHVFCLFHPHIEFIAIFFIANIQI
ncbi:hypothetical protein SAMN05216317_1205 [Nitrosomonas eutropha]|nr:hypothetical protein SAMN05216379_12238 [Nitrosomonas eutropha]SDW95009.1 hypothetical protein SAMN05216317_1205 [Nitrosomonas eutropha]SEJ04154.1 hypothetical protein SAMN05216318_12150 [Nitrosomonas eutropha]